MRRRLTSRRAIALIGVKEIRAGRGSRSRLARNSLVGLVAGLVAMLTMTSGAAAKSGPTTAFTPQSGGVYDYGIVNVGSHADQTFTLTNSGAAATAALAVSLTGSSAFTKISDTCTAASLGPGKKCSIAIRYAPTAGSASTATLTAVSTKPSAAASIMLKGTGGFVDVEISPASHDFGSTSGSQMFTATNNGNISSGAYTFTGPPEGQFGLTGNTCNGTALAPSGSCSFTIGFTAPSTCSIEPALYLESASLGNYASVTFKGQQPECQPHLTITPGYFQFDNLFNYNLFAATGSHTSQTFTVGNDGTAAATNLSIHTDFEDQNVGWSLDSASGAGDCQNVSTLPIGDSCTFSVTYTPISGCVSGTLYISDLWFLDDFSLPNTALRLGLLGVCG